ncbi:glycerate kinase [Acinetobacter baumannii]|uniref:glycerate kinase n=1 Tax=Acinetobacter baumannii TaxID=470 RepID=UPI001901788F|nr:glycerate kinase [Acinetobacter baumannii]MBJ9493359.1 glycerate kinase [Acinetobacter baumannii]MCT9183644.1 glycerate kinase [Acinetobacter baumannii]MCT9224282.1 glycerate kinase [Acinetobacter baumannii]MCT9276137.1 glycerate kinase [Acinetobacter baumannii]
MKVIIAPDSFKDSLSAHGIAEAIASGWKKVFPEAEVITCPMADGGEGSIEAVLEVCAGEWREQTVHGPLGESVVAKWGWLETDKVALIEMAQASGIQLVKPSQRDACISSTFGTGELILAALNAGAEEIVLTVGGSATNDAGTGLLTALGAKFLDKDNNVLQSGGLSLQNLTKIDLTHLDPRIKQTKFLLAADVTNPLCGINGASHIFGPQKGATPEQVLLLDNALAHFADISAALLGNDKRNEPGTGASGGLGYAAKAFLNAEFRSGIEVIAELNHLSDKISGADWVITGEGKFDGQTLNGKTPFGVAKIAKNANVPVIVIAGTLGENYQELYKYGITAAFSLTSGPINLEDACINAANLIFERTIDIARLIKTSSSIK